jgi:hypothetical protein
MAGKKAAAAKADAQPPAPPPDDEHVVVEPPVEEGKKMLSVAEQFERNTRIVAMKARGKSWPQISEAVGVGVRQCQKIHKAYREEHRTLRHHDPVSIVDELLEGYQADLADLTQVYEDADQSAAKVGAVKARREVRERITELLQAVGVLPHDLGTLRLELDAEVVIAQFMAVMERYNVPEEAFDEVLESLGGPPPGFELAAGELSPN